MNWGKISHKKLAKCCLDSYERSENFGTFSCLWEIERDAIICAFTGSNDRVDWIYNGRIQQCDSDIPFFKGRCHIGYMDLSIDVSKCIRLVMNGRHKGVKKLILTGHSLGGALASMSALRLREFNPEVVTFGSPKIFDVVGSRKFLQLIGGTHYINGLDPIPHMPRFAYSYYRNTHWLNKPNRYISFIKEHIPSVATMSLGIPYHRMEHYYNEL